MSARQPAGNPERPTGEPHRPTGEPERAAGGGGAAESERAAGDGGAAEPGRAAGGGSAAEPVTITVCPDGPLLVRGNYELLDGEDRTIDPGRATVALCRCGASTIKPFCDGSHKRIRFRAR